MDKPSHILVVCTGNLCRSPFAEGLLKRYLAGSAIAVESAGTDAPEGLTVPEEVLTVSARYGLDLSAHRSRHIAPELVRRADLVLTMTPKHSRLIRQWAPEAANKVFMLTEYGPGGGGLAISDPIGRSLAVYESVFRHIDEEIRRLLPELVKSGQGYPA